MYFGIVLELSDIDLWNTHLDLLDTDIPSKYFVCLHSVFKTSSRYVFKTSSRHVFKTSSRHVFKTSSRRLQRNNFSSSRRLGRRKIVTPKTCWRRLPDEQMFAGKSLFCEILNSVNDIFLFNKSDKLITYFINKVWKVRKSTFLIDEVIIYIVQYV